MYMYVNKCVELAQRGIALYKIYVLLLFLRGGGGGELEHSTNLIGNRFLGENICCCWPFVFKSFPCFTFSLFRRFSETRSLKKKSRLVAFAARQLPVSGKFRNFSNAD